MNATACATPIPDADIAEYWSGELPADAAGRLEDHLFSCDLCARRVAEGEALLDAVRAVVRGGRFNAVVTDAVLNRLAREGVRVRSYTLEPGSTLACAVFPEDDLVVTRLRADMTGVDTVDIVMNHPNHAAGRSAVPVEPGRTEVVYVISAAVLQQLPSATVHLTMTAASGAESRVLGEYILEHTSTSELHGGTH
jgi:anti-sigma factor RsiW